MSNVDNKINLVINDSTIEKEKTNTENAEKKISREPIAGCARIKQEYILQDQEFQNFDDKMLPENNTEKNSKNDKDESKRKVPTENQDCEEGQQQGRKKQRGQNKNRRNQMNKMETKNINKNSQMCLRFLKTGECSYGDKCYYSHDIEACAALLESQQLEGKCHLYETFGKCSFGTQCCFRSQHPVEKVNSQDKNINDTVSLNDVGSDENQKTIFSTIVNRLDKEVLNQLRKRKYDFSKANEIIKEIPKLNFTEIKREPRTPTSKKLDLVGSRKLYLAPLTTVGNLPFRRICKEFGADITCGEMALCSSLLQGNLSEWALMRRHESEDIFGVQICGAHIDQVTRAAQLINEQCDVDFIDLNMGCPIDLVYHKGAGSALMERKTKLEQIIYGVTTVTDLPLTLKMRTGVHQGKNIAKNVLQTVKTWGKDRIPLVAIHGRSREARYTKSADWQYIAECAREVRELNFEDKVNRTPMAIYGSGDVLSWEEYEEKLESSQVDGIMLARGALLKPWIFTEIKERRTWDIRSNERMDILKRYVNYGLENWGSDAKGVERTRRFLLEWLSFLYRYIPVGLLEVPPQRINERPPRFSGRDDLETLMASPAANDWIKISEMLLGKCPENFHFIPKHKANAF